MDKLSVGMKEALENLLRIDRDRTLDKRVLPERFHKVNDVIWRAMYFSTSSLFIVTINMPNILLNQVTSFIRQRVALIRICCGCMQE